MKKVLTICMIVAGAVMGANANASDNGSVAIGRLRKSLEQMHLTYDERENAYISLIKSGPVGFEVICDLVCQGKITINEWINWHYDYSTRFADETKNQDSFDNFLFTRAEKDESFARSVVDHLFSQNDLSNEVVHSSVAGAGNLQYLSYLKDERPGVRRIGYLALQKQNKDLPPFDYEADEKTRTKEIQDIEAFINIPAGIRSGHLKSQ